MTHNDEMRALRHAVIAAAVGGFIATNEIMSEKQIADSAIIQADAVIAALERERGEEEE